MVLNSFILEAELEERFGQEQFRDEIHIYGFVAPLCLCYGKVARLRASDDTLHDAIRRRSIEILVDRKELLAAHLLRWKPPKTTSFPLYLHYNKW